MMRSFTMNDYKEFARWFRLREIEPPDPIFLPTCGVFIEGLAAGFLIKTDCKFGILDFFISNIEETKQKRQKALQEIAEKLVLDAQWAGMKCIKCDTKFDNIRRLAEKLNFKYLGECSTFVKGL